MTRVPRDSAAAGHLPYVDGLRGYLIFAMTVGHVIAITGAMNLNWLTHKPFALFLTGEGFMAISGFMCGYILVALMARRGAAAGLRWGLRRVLRIVLHYLAVCALCALPVFVLPLEGTAAQMLFHGRTGFDATDLLLLAGGLYRPAFFDILYLYVVFIALAPLMVLMARGPLRWGLLGLSLLAWLLTQYGATTKALEAVFALIPVARMSEAGSFHVFAWQLLFVLGLIVGVQWRDAPPMTRVLQPAAMRAVLVVLACFAVVRLLGQLQVWPLGMKYLADYLKVAPMPLLNFALAVLALSTLLRDPAWRDTRAARLAAGLLRLPPFRVIGAHTLQSFAASIVLSYWAAWMIPAEAKLSLPVALVLLFAIMAGVHATASVMALRKRSRRTPRRDAHPAPIADQL